jgi:hypothetical protein
VDKSSPAAGILLLSRKVNEMLEGTLLPLLLQTARQADNSPDFTVLLKKVAEV